MHLITTTLFANTKAAPLVAMSAPTAAWADPSPGRGGQGGVVITKTTSISTAASTTDTPISAAGVGSGGGGSAAGTANGRSAAGTATKGRGSGAAGNDGDVITSTQTSTQIVTLRPSVTSVGTGLGGVSAAAISSSFLTQKPTLSTITTSSPTTSSETTAMSASPTTHEPVPSSPTTTPISVQQSAKRPFLQTPGGIVTIVFVIFIILALAILGAWFYRRKKQRADQAAFRELDGEEAAMRRDQGDWGPRGGGVPLRVSRDRVGSQRRPTNPESNMGARGEEGSSGSDGEKMGKQPGTPFTSPFGSMRRPRPAGTEKGEKIEVGDLGASTAAHPGNMLPEERVEEYHRRKAAASPGEKEEEYRRKATASPVSENPDERQPTRQPTSPQTVRDDAILARQGIKTRMEAEREKRMKDGIRDYPSPSSSPKPVEDAAAAVMRKQSRRERRADREEKRNLGRQANPDLTTSGFLTSLEEEKRISAEKKQQALRERERDATRTNPIDSPAREQGYDISGHPIRAPSPPRQFSKETGKPLALTRDQVVLPAIWTKTRGQPVQQQQPEEENGTWTVVNWEDMTPAEQAQETERARLEKLAAAEKEKYEARPPGGGRSQAVIDSHDYRKNITVYPRPARPRRSDEYDPLVGPEERYEGAGPDAYMSREPSTQLMGQDYDPYLARGSPAVPEKHPDRMVGYGGEEINARYYNEPDRMVQFLETTVPPPGPAWKGPPDQDLEDEGETPGDSPEGVPDQGWDLRKGPRRGPPRHASPVESRPKPKHCPPIPSNAILRATRRKEYWDLGFPGFMSDDVPDVEKGGEGGEGEKT